MPTNKIPYFKITWSGGQTIHWWLYPDNTIGYSINQNTMLEEWVGVGIEDACTDDLMYLHVDKYLKMPTASGSPLYNALTKGDAAEDISVSALARDSKFTPYNDDGTGGPFRAESQDSKNQIHKCNCDLQALMIAGCKCGGA